jgi:hypothetical protein
MANFHPRELWLPEAIPSDEIRGLLTVAQQYDVQLVYHKAGDSFGYAGRLFACSRLIRSFRFACRTAMTNRW